MPNPTTRLSRYPIDPLTDGSVPDPRTVAATVPPTTAPMSVCARARGAVISTPSNANVIGRRHGLEVADL
jgi:hypothetical protein